MNDFKEQYRFNPNTAAKEIASEQLLEFAELVKGTSNEELIAYKDSKVQELVDYIMSAIIIENERINSDGVFPIQIYRRYKSDNSLADKMDEWALRPEKTGTQVTDYLGFKIIPEAEHSVFFSGGDPVLREMINKREKIRSFIAEKYEILSEKNMMSFQQYKSHCVQVLDALQDVFPEEAVARVEHYSKLSETIARDLAVYTELVEDAEAPISLEKIEKITNVNIKQLLSELTFNYPNEVILYKLKNDLMNVFQTSELLKNLGISVSDNEQRTKRKSTSNGYRSEFIGLDLSIRTEDGRLIQLPIECQVQTMEQYKDGNLGFSAHTKLPDKEIFSESQNSHGKNKKLKSIPGTLSGTFKDPQGNLDYYRTFLSHIMHISPSCAIAKTTGNDFEDGRTIITPYDLYEAFRLISRIPKDSRAFRAYSEYLGELYKRRETIFPTGESLLPKYIRFEDIPNPNADYTTYNQFFNELRSSLKNTLKVLNDVGEKNPEAQQNLENSINLHEGH